MPDLYSTLHFNDHGLIPVIVQESGSGEILMHAWMNRDALAKTLESGKMHYWSRSRQQLWYKGETSGQIQEVLSLATDCDYDTLLATVKQHGVACHTGRKSCFFYGIEKDGSLTTLTEPEVLPEELYKK